MWRVNETTLHSNIKQVDISHLWIERLVAKWCEGTYISVNNCGPWQSSKLDLLTWIRISHADSSYRLLL